MFGSVTYYTTADSRFIQAIKEGLADGTVYIGAPRIYMDTGTTVWSADEGAHETENDLPGIFADLDAMESRALLVCDRRAPKDLDWQTGRQLAEDVLSLIDALREAYE